MSPNDLFGHTLPNDLLGHASPDDLLGRAFTFYCATPPWGVVAHALEVVAYDPARGWKLAGSHFAPAWVSVALWERLLDEEVLVPR